MIEYVVWPQVSPYQSDSCGAPNLAAESPSLGCVTWQWENLAFCFGDLCAFSISCSRNDTHVSHV